MSTPRLALRLRDLLLVPLLTLASVAPLAATEAPRIDWPGAEEGRVLPDEEAEARYRAPYLHRAHGQVQAPGVEAHARHDWPFPPLSIGHTMASYQRYGFRPYFHHGLDIRGDAGTPVLAAVGGTVVNVGNYNGGSYLYWEVAILDADGYLWQYHHVNHETIPQAVREAFEAGGEVPAGQHLGDIVEWPADTYGETYHHVHLNVLAEGGVYLNPFDFMQLLPDDAPPQVKAIGVLDAEGHPVEGGVASGAYSLFAEVSDLVLHEHFTVPPYRIEVRVDGGEPFTVWSFDSLPGGDSITTHLKDFYVEAATCGNYQCRKATVDLGFVPGGQRAFPSEPGSHVAEVVVRDYRGNVAARSFRWTVAE